MLLRFQPKKKNFVSLQVIYRVFLFEAVFFSPLDLKHLSIHPLYTSQGVTQKLTFFCSVFRRKRDPLSREGQCLFIGICSLPDSASLKKKLETSEALPCAP